jgi:putative pyruvate formate lyase activating enzyme
VISDAVMTRRVDYLRRSLKRCVLCPQVCRVDRTAGARGVCGLASGMVMSSYLPHHGEEPPLSGTHGAGTIFFSSCNLRCLYCQNYQISHAIRGRAVSEGDLAGIMLELEAQGCHNIDLVTPTPHLTGIISSILIARERGLSIPIVYNCGGYEREKIIRFVDGLIDIYLPDFKYGLAEVAHRYSGVRDYTRHALLSLKEMVRQVGDTLELEEGIAKRGILVRHLVLPGGMDSSLAVLRMIRDQVSSFVPLSLMAQYTPVPSVMNDPFLGRRVTRKEYERVVNAAVDMGFEEIYTQEVDDRVLNPDFTKEVPFSWEGK